LRLRRDLALPPLNWGNGRHFCVGRPLAVMEMQETLEVMLERWAEFEIEEHSLDGAPYLISPARLVVRTA
jgi:cytochrome P450